MASIQYAKIIPRYVGTAGHATDPTVFDSSPLMHGTHAIFRSLDPDAQGPTTVYGVDLPSESFYPTNAKYLKVVMPSAGTTLVSTEYPTLLNADAVDTAAMSATNVLRVVLKVNSTLWARVASDTTPLAGEFKVAGTDPITLTFGASVAAGSLVELFMNDAADIVTVAVVADGVTQQKQVREVMVASEVAIVEVALVKAV